jgi:GMP synthase (glutamine-hydrolysing)
MKSSGLFIPGGTVLVIDYGGQYTHLIARRLRELGVLALIEPYTRIREVELSEYSAIVLSGSYRSVFNCDELVEESARIALSRLEPPFWVFVLVTSS